MIYRYYLQQKYNLIRFNFNIFISNNIVRNFLTVASMHDYFSVARFSIAFSLPSLFMLRASSHSLFGVDPALHPSQGGRWNAYYGVFRRIMRPPGVAPWLYPSLGTEHFDDIVLHPLAAESAVGVPLIYVLFMLQLSKRDTYIFRNTLRQYCAYICAYIAEIFS